MTQHRQWTGRVIHVRRCHGTRRGVNARGKKCARGERMQVRWLSEEYDAWRCVTVVKAETRSTRRICDERRNGTNLLELHRHCCRHHLQVDAQQTVWSANNESSEEWTGNKNPLTTRHQPSSCPTENEERGVHGWTKGERERRTSYAHFVGLVRTRWGCISGWPSRKTICVSECG